MLFVAHKRDTAGSAALSMLARYETRLIEDGEYIPSEAIGIFGANLGEYRCLRIAPHRMKQEGIDIPAWATSLPFVVAVNTNIIVSGRRKRLRRALEDVARGYEAWRPWMKEPEAPWKPRWHLGNRHAKFEAWHSQARQVVGDVSTSERISFHLDQVFAGHETNIDRLLVVPCALFNKPHTDVVVSIPENKRLDVVRTLGSILHDASVRDVHFIVPGPDLLDPRLRLHFHPFMFESIERVEVHLSSRIGHGARLLKHTHARNDMEVAEALDISAAYVKTNIVRPVEDASGVSVQACSWTECMGQYFHIAHSIALAHRNEAEAIYLERVRTRPSYASLHAFDPDRGVERTIANNVLYIAEALYLKDHPTTAIVSCEFADTFWKGLESVLATEVWGGWRPFIGMLPMKARQPWSY